MEHPKLTRPTTRDDTLPRSADAAWQAEWDAYTAATGRTRYDILQAMHHTNSAPVRQENQGANPPPWLLAPYFRCAACPEHRDIHAGGPLTIERHMDGVHGGIADFEQFSLPDNLVDPAVAFKTPPSLPIVGSEVLPEHI